MLTSNDRSGAYRALQLPHYLFTSIHLCVNPVGSDLMPSLCSRLWSVSTVLLLTLTAATAWSTPPQLAPPPLKLFESTSVFTPQGQMDDPELVRELSGEETLVDLQNIEYEREALSQGRGVLLSAIPGAGWSLIYANRKAQGVLVILGSLAGYGLGAAYLAGAFDESAQRTCNLTAFDVTSGAKGSRVVGFEYCDPASEIHPTDAQATMSPYDPHLLRNYGASDPNQRVILKVNELPPGYNGYSPPQYNEVRNLYQEQRRGSDYDGAADGRMIIATTYAVTTLLAAVWSWVEIDDQNDELRKRIESTAQGAHPSSPQPAVVGGVRPTFAHDGQQTMMGLGGHF